MKKLIIFIIAIGLMMAGCEGKKGPKGEPGSDYIPPGVDRPVEVENPLGIAFKGPFRKRTQVLVYPLNEDWSQLDGGPYRGETESNDGSYQIRATVVGSHVRYLLGPGSSYNEADGVWADGVELSLRTINNPDPKNLCVLTSIADTVAFERFIDPSHPAYENSILALRYGRNETIAYFDFTDQIGSTLLQDTSLQGDTTADAASWAASLVVGIGKGSDGRLINDYIQEIANGVTTNDLTLKADIASTISDMEWKRVSDLLKNIHADLEIDATFPPFWNLPGVPAYYSDLLERTPVEMESKNTTQTSRAGIGLSTYSRFIWPIRFTVPGKIEGSRYIELDVNNGDLSIWTKGAVVNGYEIPGIKLVDMVRLREALLPGGMAANYDLGENHGLTTGTDYILVQEKSTPSDELSPDTGDRVPFGQNSAYNGTSWLPDNVTGRFVTEIKWRLWD